MLTLRKHSTLNETTTFCHTHRSVCLVNLAGTDLNKRYLGSSFFEVLSEGEYQMFLKPDAWRYEGSDRFFEKYVEGDLQYLWLKGDQEILISLGAAIWLADVIWVFAKSSNNIKFINATRQGSGLKLGYLPGGMSLNYSYVF